MTTIHVYESHLSGVYFTKEYDESWAETCEQCGNSDWYVGVISSEEELWEFMNEEGYQDDYIEEAVKEYYKERERLNE